MFVSAGKVGIGMAAPATTLEFWNGAANSAGTFYPSLRLSSVGSAARTASLVMNAGPARRASAIFSLSVA
jgi:hypothetical protein